MSGRGESAVGVDLKLHQLLFDSSDRLRDHIRGKIPRRLAAAVSVDDILQEVWLTVFVKFSTFRWDRPDAFDRWLFTIANNKLIDIIRTADRVRRGGAQTPMDPPEQAGRSAVPFLDLVALSGQTPSRDAAKLEAVAAVRDAIEALPDEQRQVVCLFHLEGQTRPAIARNLKLSETRVKYLLDSARRTLRSRLGRADRFFTDVPTVEAPSGRGGAAP